jgi:hypothetical protein
LVVAQSNRLAKSLSKSFPNRPARVVKLRGIILQSDKTSFAGAWVIRPVEMLDLHLAGIGRSPNAPPLAMHAGLHVILEDDREFVVEQLLGNLREDLVDGLNWTPLETFRKRDHRGWDVTVPATAFRQVAEDVVDEVVEFLNSIEGRPFFGEDCTMLIERAFGKRRLFADSPTARALGFGMRVGDPALTLLKPGVALEPDAERLLRADILRKLPDPTTPWNGPERPPLDSSCLGVATDLRSCGWTPLVHSTQVEPPIARGAGTRIMPFFGGALLAAPRSVRGAFGSRKRLPIHVV